MPPVTDMILQRLCSLCDPCFVFRPDIFLRACVRRLRARPERAVVRSAWGDAFEVNPRRFIGAHLYMRGVHELPVCEVLARLAVPGERVADIGANLGVMSSILSRSVGPSGQVLSVEAHPGMVEQLRRNVALWGRSNVRIVHAVMSDRVGRLAVVEPSGFGENEGLACVTSTDAGDTGVPALPLDDLLGDDPLGVLKVDVEGHEHQVLAGARRSLEARRIRDIVYEAPALFPGPVHQLLLDAGYTILRIGPAFRGVRLTGPCTSSAAGGSLCDHLATLEPERARKLLRPAGWNVLRAKPPGSSGQHRPNFSTPQLFNIAAA